MADYGRKRKEMGPPPRWMRCPRKGTIIAEKFLPFKTPLDDSYDHQVPADCTFSPQMMIASLESYKVKMGLWIDLTNTSRFYNKKFIEGNGIKYVKLQCRGHGECPDARQTSTFIELCQLFIAKNPLSIIGVHCTHGFNRTGFLIAAYLVESLSWSVEAAIATFAQARQPGIYKQDYLLELFTRFGDPSDTPQAPVLPSWCNEEDDVNDDGVPLDEVECASKDVKPPPHKKRKEFVKKNAAFMEGVPGVTTVSDPEIIAIVQKRCQAMCDWKGRTGFPGSQPVSMDNNNLELLQKMPYQVSWKADGTRYMMLIDGKNKCFFIDRDNAVFQPSNLFFPRRKSPAQHISNTLLDGEMIIDKVSGTDVPRYLVYDIIKFEGIDVGKTDFARRSFCIKKEIIGPRVQGMEEGRIDRNQEPFSVRAKDFWDIITARQILSEKFSKNMSHEVDGLVFQPMNIAYIPGQCNEVLKWKPPSLNSVDFKLMITKVCGEGLLPTSIGYLFVGGLDTCFAQIKVTKTLRPLDKKIIECKFDNNEWVFLRERTDKSFPNSYKTAMSVCNSIKNPVTSEKLFFFIENYRWMPEEKQQSSSET